MYQVTTGIFIHFAHHIRGHAGPCISLHGHTWKFELSLGASELGPEGFVVDFDDVHSRVLEPCHRLLDHSLALGRQSYQEVEADLAAIGEKLVASRQETLGCLGERQPGWEGELGGARNAWPGGIKLAVFEFAPTSERLAEWLYRVASTALGDGRVRVTRARVCETLHPVEATAEYAP